MSYIENHSAYDRAVRRNIVNNARKTFLKRDRAQEVVNWLYSARGDFAASLLDSYVTYGKLTDKQFDAVLRCIERDAAKKAEWEAKRLEMAALGSFVGDEGGKISLTNVKVEAVLTIGARSFSYYDRDSQEMYLLRDEAGNRLVFKTKNFISVEKGDVVNLTAKVKAHQEFRGEKQTLINRAKFERVEVAA
jgi:hypothetical protein